LTNARDALNERYPEYHENKVLTITAKQTLESDRPWIRIAVEDHGRGISPDDQERIFDPFFSTKVREKGTGLGLFVSYGLIRDHHGRLLVESEPGVRTRFIVELPADVVNVPSGTAEP
jgi:signal transduction histidine kinase